MSKRSYTLRGCFGAIFLLCSVVVAQAGFDGDPLYANTQQTNGASFYAWRPFYSHHVEGERWRKDYLWPLYTRKGFQDELYSRFLFFGYSNDFSKADERHRNWILPFWYSGVDKEGIAYWALWPFYGHIHDFLGRDKIFFAAWPLYTTAQVNDVKSTSVCWPIYSKVDGGKVTRRRIWPFYVRSSVEGEFNKTYILWPIYNQVEYTNEKNKGGGVMIFPLYGRIKTVRGDNQWYIPPFGRYMNSDQQRIIYAPWPFFQLADGVMYKRIFWPLYGTKELGTLKRTYLLWPFLWNNRTTYATDTQYRKFMVPFIASEKHVVTKKHDDLQVGEVSSRYWKAWPLMSWERTRDESRFRVLDLWPMRNTPGIERNWAPYWTLYRRMNVQGAVEHHLLWGLYRQQQKNGRFEWSLLKGLAGYKNTPSGKQYRFCFMRFGGQQKEKSDK